LKNSLIAAATDGDLKIDQQDRFSTGCYGRSGGQKTGAIATS
jgi:hypothetical protein